MKYLVNSPWWLRMLYPNLLWHKDRSKPEVYLTFDDGPHPEITPWVLKQLEAYQAQATFFLIGDNARKYPEITEQVKQAGHLTGNHTFHHTNGWQTDFDTYMQELKQCAPYVDPGFFRPPYGRIKPKQARAIIQNGYEVVMWDIISGDFDAGTSLEQCYRNVEKNLKPGSVIVFHDSEKAWPRLKEVLPKTLDLLQKKGLISRRLD
ncbi:MAG: polysaccharide deacetylase family protein [Owenweeksia sp.]